MKGKYGNQLVVDVFEGGTFFLKDDLQVLTSRHNSKVLTNLVLQLSLPRVKYKYPSRSSSGRLLNVDPCKWSPWLFHPST